MQTSPSQFIIQDSVMPVFTSQQEQYFCFLLIKQSYSVYLAYVYCPIILIFTIFAIRQVIKLSKLNQLPRMIKIIYTLLFVWSSICIAQIILSYYLYKKTVGISDVDTYLSKMSRLTFIFVFVAIFILQTAVILTPYQWMKTLIQFYSIRLSKELKQTIISEAQQFIFPPKINKIQKKCKKTIQIYFVVRLLLFATWIIFILIIFQQNNVEKYRWLTLFTLNFVLLESIITLAILLIGVYAIKKNEMLKQLVEQDQIKQMLRRYYFLIGSTVFRIIGFAIRTYAPSQKIKLQVIQNHCSVLSQGYLLGLFILGLQALLMDFIPFMTMLKIYRVEQDLEEPTEENRLYLSKN